MTRNPRLIAHDQVRRALQGGLAAPFAGVRLRAVDGGPAYVSVGPDGALVVTAAPRADACAKVRTDGVVVLWGGDHVAV